MHDNFCRTLDSLFNQTIEVDYVVINLCKSYKRNFIYDNEILNKKIKEYDSKYGRLIINICENDYGPITKVLGLYEWFLKLNDDDLVIVIDDDLIMDKNTVFLYVIANIIYSTEFIVIDEKIFFRNIISLDIIKNNYSTSLYGWASFGMKYKNLENLYNYYNKIILLDENLWKHDDLIMTMFFKEHNLSCSEITVFLSKCDGLLDSISPLRNDNYENQNYRYLLRKKFNDNIKNYKLEQNKYLTDEEEINRYLTNIKIKYENNNIRFVKI